MLVFGWGNISMTKDGEQVSDLQGDNIDPEELEKAAYNHVLEFRSTGERHNPALRKKGRLVESCVFTKEKQEAIGIPPNTVPVGWWVGYKIDDPETWEKIKNGEYKMFSIEGTGEREPVKDVEKSDGKDETAKQTAAQTFADIISKNDSYMLKFSENDDTIEAEESTSAKTFLQCLKGRTYDSFGLGSKTVVFKSKDKIISFEKFNPYHDSRGRFTSANGAAIFTFKPGASRAHDNAIAREKERTKQEDEKKQQGKLKQGLVNGLGKEHAEKIESLVQNAPKEIQDVWNKYGDEIEVSSANTKDAKCNAFGRIYVDKSTDTIDTSINTPYETVMHESGHSIETAISRKMGKRGFAYAVEYKNGLFEKTIKQEVDESLKRLEKELLANSEWVKRHPAGVIRGGKKVRVGHLNQAMGNELRRTGPFKETGDVSDMFGGATKGAIVGTGGHGKSYWKGRSFYGMKMPGTSVATEAFAEMFSASIANSKSLANIKKYFPKSYDVFIEMMKGASEL